MNTLSGELDNNIDAKKVKPQDGMIDEVNIKSSSVNNLSSLIWAPVEDTISHDDVKFRNIRIWCVITFATWFITDILLIYPKFKEKPIVPN